MNEEEKEKREKDRCKVRLCSPDGSTCPRCGRVVFKERGARSAVADVPVAIDHGI
jgi:hypothetical protein